MYVTIWYYYFIFSLFPRANHYEVLSVGQSLWSVLHMQKVCKSWGVVKWYDNNDQNYRLILAVYIHWTMPEQISHH